MKKLIIAALLLVMTVAVQAQNATLAKVAELDGASSVLLPKAVLNMVAQKGGMDNNAATATGITAEDLKHVESVQMISIQKKGTAKKARKILEPIKTNARYELLAQAKDGESKQEVVAYAGPAGSDTLSEVLLIVDQHDKGLQIIDLIGTFSREKLTQRAQKLAEEGDADQGE